MLKTATVSRRYRRAAATFMVEREGASFSARVAGFWACLSLSVLCVLCLPFKDIRQSRHFQGKLCLIEVMIKSS